MLAAEHRLRAGDAFQRAVRNGTRSGSSALVVHLRLGVEPGMARVGFVVGRGIGGAVVRNRAKRRLREAARLLLPEHGVPGRDGVFVARGGTTARPWARLLDDVKSALISLAAARPGAPPGPDRSEPPPAPTS